MLRSSDPLDETEELDCSWLAQWPWSAQLTLELIETAAYSRGDADANALRGAMRNAKTAEETLKEVTPFKDLFEAVEEAIKTEQDSLKKKATTPGTGNDGQDNQDSSGTNPESGASKAGSSSSTPAATEADDKESHAKRHLASHMVLEVEGSQSQSQLAQSLAKHALVKANTKGHEPMGGNVLIIFDVNGYGETVTAPHIRRPQLSTDVLRKLLRSLNLARHGVADPPMVPEGEIHLVVNGGRQNNAVFSKMYGVGPGVRGRRPDPGTGATVCRQTTLLFNETSVKTRKVRLAKGRLAVVKCTQGLLTWYNTNTSIPSRPHKFFPETTNAGDTYGPIALEAWEKLPFLTVADKKLFWGKRLMSFETKYTHTCNWRV